jgi:hypothetical protein
MKQVLSADNGGRPSTMGLLRAGYWRLSFFVGAFAIQLIAGTATGTQTTAPTGAVSFDNATIAISNTMKIVDVTYDEMSSKMRVTYQIDDLGFQYQIGFSWIMRPQGIAPLPTEFFEPAISPRMGEVVYTDKIGQINTYEFDIANATPLLEYTQGYYFGGWVSKVGEAWALPTDASIFYYTLPQPSVVPVVIFKDTDFVTAFSNWVVLCKVDPIETKVNLQRVDNLPFEGSGLVPVSYAFKIETNISSPVRIVTGLQYSGVLVPAGATANDIRMYHYDEVRMAWLIDTAAIVPDAGNAPVLYVEKYLSECAHPFLLAVDLIEPTITVTGDTSSALTWGKSIEMTVRVSDNIANPRAWLAAGRGDEAMQYYKNEVVMSGVDMPWEISSGVVQGACGIRVLAGANDGRFSPVVDVSRDVRFTKADGMNPVRERWTPLSATGVLDTPSVKQVLNEYGTAGGTWKYDIYRFRLFRFLKTGWIEYAEANQDLFRFEPGRVIWLKTRNEEAIDLGSGRSVSLKSPFGIQLPGKSWTDFCLPYKFNIRIGDILRCNNAALGSAVQIYRWDRSGKGGRYSATGIHIPANGIGKLTDTLFHTRSITREKVAYTVWNPLPTDNTLWIPGLPLVYSSVSAAKSTAQVEPRWSVAVRSSDPEGDLSPVFCAYVAGGKGTTTYPQPPAWSAVTVGIVDRSLRTVCGNLIAHEIANGGYTYELVFENGQPGRTRVVYAIERIKGDQSVEIAVIDPKTGAVAAAESALNLEVPGNSREYRLLAIGSAAYVKGAGRCVQHGKFAVHRIAPNPFRGRVVIEYTVPYDVIERIRCEIIDCRGRMVWSARPEGRVIPGRNSIIWTPDRNARLASGTYFFRLTGYDGRGNKFGEKLAKVMYLP